MIAIINIPVKVRIEPNVCIGYTDDDSYYEVDTFEITHEMCGIGMFEVTIKHLGENNKNLRDITLTMNYDDLKALYNAPSATITSIYNHYADDIDEWCTKPAVLTVPNSVVFMDPENKAKPVLAVIFDSKNRQDDNEKMHLNLMREGYTDIYTKFSDISMKEYDEICESMEDKINDDPFYKIYQKLVNDYNNKKSAVAALEMNDDDKTVDELFESLKQTPGVEVTEF